MEKILKTVLKVILELATLFPGCEGYDMGFLVAVVGRFGVGKSLLCDHFIQQGALNINIIQTLQDSFSGMPNQSVWHSCLLHDYDSVVNKIPIFTESDGLNTVLEQIKKKASVCQQCIVELPSFIDLSPFVQRKIFDYVIAVDCEKKVQKEYLEKVITNNLALKSILESGYERSYYTKIATDIFLNSVNLEQLEWVSKQILSSYKAIDTYKEMI
jgi:dephospho-CoA kinase